MSVELFVVRHAIAFERDAERWPDDADRPLTRKGEKLFRRAARGAVTVADRPDVMLSSPYARAWRTAEILHEEGWPEPQRFDALEAERSPEEAILALAAWAGADKVAIVGHRPQLGLLCGKLARGEAIELKKGAVARLSVDSFEPGGATLRWLLSPNLLRRLGR
jgi:phosphohistidine phosphatase